MAIPTADAEFSNMVLKNVTSPRHGAKGGCLPENLIALMGMDTQRMRGRQIARPLRIGGKSG